MESSLAKVNEKRVQMVAGGLHEKLLEIQEKEQKKQKGVWSTDGKLLDKHRRELIFYGESDYNPITILANSQKEPRPLGAILEHVFSSTLVTLFIKSINTVIKC